MSPRFNKGVTSAWITSLPVKLMLGAMALVVLLLVADFALGMLTSIKIVNASGTDFRRVDVAMADARVWSGPLKDGEEHEVLGNPSGEGAFRVDIEIADGRRLSQEFGYATSFLGGKYFITVRRPLNVSIVGCDGGIFVDHCTD